MMVCVSGEGYGRGGKNGKEGDGFVVFGGGERRHEKGVGTVLWCLLLGLRMNIKIVE